MASPAPYSIRDGGPVRLSSFAFHVARSSSADHSSSSESPTSAISGVSTRDTSPDLQGGPTTRTGRGLYSLESGSVCLDIGGPGGPRMPSSQVSQLALALLHHQQHGKIYPYSALSPSDLTETSSSVKDISPESICSPKGSHKAAFADKDMHHRQATSASGTAAAPPPASARGMASECWRVLSGGGAGGGGGGAGLDPVHGVNATSTPSTLASSTAVVTSPAPLSRNNSGLLSPFPGRSPTASSNFFAPIDHLVATSSAEPVQSSLATSHFGNRSSNNNSNNSNLAKTNSNHHFQNSNLRIDCSRGGIGNRASRSTPTSPPFHTASSYYRYPSLPPVPSTPTHSHFIAATCAPQFDQLLTPPTPSLSASRHNPLNHTVNSDALAASAVDIGNMEPPPGPPSYLMTPPSAGQDKDQSGTVVPYQWTGAGAGRGDAKLTTGQEYAYCYDRGNGQYTRLIPADMLPDLKDVPRLENNCSSMIVLPIPAGLAPNGRSTNSEPVVWKDEKTGIQNHIDQIVASNPNTTTPPAPVRRTKIYCDKWVHEGVCAFTQQGCKYKHEMPFDRATQHALGLFHGLPAWWKKHQADLARQRRETDLEEATSDQPLAIGSSSSSSRGLGPAAGRRLLDFGGGARDYQDLSGSASAPVLGGNTNRLGSPGGANQDSACGGGVMTSYGGAGTRGSHSSNWRRGADGSEQVQQGSSSSASPYGAIGSGRRGALYPPPQYSISPYEAAVPVTPPVQSLTLAMQRSGLTSPPGRAGPVAADSNRYTMLADGSDNVDDDGADYHGARLG